MNVDAGDLGVVVALIAAAGLALGPVVKAIVDALKGSFIPNGWAGVSALAIGILIGGVVGVLAALRAGDWSWVLTGGLGGALAGAQAVAITHQAIGANVASGTGAIVHNQAAIGAQTEKAVTPVVPVTKATSAAEPVTTPAPVVTPAAKPAATTASTVSFTPAADPKASSSGALDV